MNRAPAAPGSIALSIVVPLYDEQDNVGPLCAAVRDALADRPGDWELLLVDDGSLDATLSRALEESSEDPRLRIIAMHQNQGQTAAMANGFAYARGRVIVSMDGDLQNDPRDIPLLLSRLDDGYDVVCGWRRDRKDAWLSRTLPSKVANRMIAWLTGIRIHDNGCSLKAYRAEAIRSIHLYAEMHRFLPALSSMTGARIAEVVVRHHPRVHGRSKYGISRTFKVLSDMIAIKLVTQFAQRPGKLFGASSLPWIIAGLGCLWLWAAAPGGKSSIVAPSLAVVMLYLAGNMLALAVLGELFLLYADHGYIRRLATALSRTWTVGDSPDGRVGELDE